VRCSRRMRRLAPLVVVWLVPALAVAETDMRFAYYRDPSIPIEAGGLGDFLNDFIGACRGFFDGQRCKDKAGSFRAERAGKSHWATIPEGEAAMLEMVGYNPKTNGYTLRITPVFAEGGYILSQGKPERFDDQGNPLFRVIDLPLTVKKGKRPMDVARLLSEKVMRVQVIFTPREHYQYGSEASPRFGVAADLHAILVTIAANGEKFAAWYEEKPAAPKQQKR
jgi:hypothetical protein